MNTYPRLLPLLVLLAAVSLSACGTDDDIATLNTTIDISNNPSGSDSENSSADAEEETTDSATAAERDPADQASSGTGTTISTGYGALSDDELADLRFMREEEKLAMDVYDALYTIWNRAVFDNISDSESQHVEAMLGLFDKYGIADFAADNAPGEFDDANLQALYDQLMTQAEPSLIHALEVGAIIEETDILDIQHAIDRVEGKDDIVMAYENLMQGSRNHLRAFVKNLDSLGYTYEPQFLSQDAYDAIVNSEQENGNGR